MYPGEGAEHLGYKPVACSGSWEAKGCRRDVFREELLVECG